MKFTTKRRWAWAVFALITIYDLIELGVLIAALTRHDWLEVGAILLLLVLMTPGVVFIIGKIREFGLLAQIERTGDSATDTNSN